MQELQRYKVTYILVGLIAFFYLYSSFQSGHFDDIPARTLVELGGVFAPLVVLDNEWYRILFSMFLHGGITHVVLNGVSLIFVGRALEEYFERLEYLVIYFMSGIIAAMASIYFHPLNVLIGASGAIFGVFGALIGFFIFHRRRMMHQFKELMQSIGVILIINLAIGLIFPTIDMVAHIGGLLFGLFAGFLGAYSLKSFWGYVLVMGIATVIFGAYLPEIYAQYL
jgi:rhomboid protease GluP